MSFEFQKKSKTILSKKKKIRAQKVTSGDELSTVYADAPPTTKQGVY